jgi:hypothetical protein
MDSIGASRNTKLISTFSCQTSFSGKGIVAEFVQELSKTSSKQYRILPD